MRKKIIPKKPYNTSGYHVTDHAVKRMKERNGSKGGSLATIFGTDQDSRPR